MRGRATTLRLPPRRPNLSSTIGFALMPTSVHPPPETTRPSPVGLSPGKPSSDSPTSATRPVDTAGQNGSAVVNVQKPSRRSLTHPGWLMFNVVGPLLLCAAGVAIILSLGTVVPSTREPLDNTPAGRLLALPAVRVAPVRSLQSSGGTLVLGVDGVVVPYREAIIATEVAGRVIEKSADCETGRYVTEGTLLVRIDPTDYDLEIERLQLSQQQEYEQIREADQEVTNTRKLVELAETDIELANREVRRLESLPQNFASRGELDQARRAALAAEQTRVSLQNQIDLLLKRKARLEAAERLAGTQLKAAQTNRQRTEIRAPISGVIVAESAELNSFVARGAAIVTIDDTTRAEVTCELRADQLYWVMNQQGGSGESSPTDTYRLPPTPVEIVYNVSGRDDVRYVWDGQLLGYDGIGFDEQTRTVPIRIGVPKPRQYRVERSGKLAETDPATTKNGSKTIGPSALVKGMYVDVRLRLRPTQPLVVLPAESLKPGNRVWRFSTNLDLIGGPISSGSIEDAEPTDEQPSLTSSTETFDPTKWVPGDLVVLNTIRPVDEMPRGMVSGESGTPEDSLSKMWICEVPDGSLTDGSYVVVSPLGDVKTDQLPVRASAESVGK